MIYNCDKSNTFFKKNKQDIMVACIIMYNMMDVDEHNTNAPIEDAVEASILNVEMVRMKILDFENFLIDANKLRIRGSYRNLNCIN